MTPLTVYKASAGSGKTFRLAVEYIKLLVANPASYPTILAVTFTNKATEEMKMRILSQLHGIANGYEDSAIYLKTVTEELEMGSKQVQQNAKQALKNLLSNYHYFRVETIDAFFQRVLRNLARELELTANLQVGLNDKQVEHEAVDMLIEGLQANSRLLEWVMKYITQNISEDKSWNIIGQMKRFGENIFKDFYKEKSRQLNERIHEKDFFENYTQRLYRMRAQAEKDISHMAESFFDTLHEYHITEEELAYGQTGVLSYWNKLRGGTFDNSIVGKRVLDCLENPDKWLKKKNARYKELLPIVSQTLQPMLVEAERKRPQLYGQWQSCNVTLRHLSQLRLLSHIEALVREMNTEANRFLLSDTQTLLHTLIGENDSPFIFEKIGARLKHIMIDEFQDTGTVQWQNFRLLLQECMSQKATSSLIVGDVKQSIYRWRSGDWRLLNDIEKQFAHPEEMLHVVSLSQNFRSEKRVIWFNNIFFSKAAQAETQRLENEGTEGAQTIGTAYKDICQTAGREKEEQGWVHVELLPTVDYQQNVLNKTVETVRTLTAAGIRTNEIAILVRYNRDIPLIANHFLLNMPEVQLVSDEAFRLDASMAVNMLIDAMHILICPDDAIATASLAKAYQALIRQEPTTDSELFLSVGKYTDLLPQEFVCEANDLLAMPVMDMAERLFCIFQLHRLPAQSAYLCSFFDTMRNYFTNTPGGIEDFLREWNENFHANTIQSDEQNGIRLISVHKSKGLEFHSVIIPFCDWQLDKQGDQIWCSPSQQPFDELPIVPVDYYRKQLQGTIYEADYQNEHLQNTVDNLNLLYVAFTRACKNLIVFGKMKSQNTRSGVLETCLPLVAKELDTQKKNAAALLVSGGKDESLTFDYGSVTEGKKEKKKDMTKNIFLKSPSMRTIAIHTTQPIATFRQSNQSQRFIEGEADETHVQQNFIRRGNVLHQVFSQIKTTQDIAPVLEQMELDGVLSKDDISQQEVWNLLQTILANPIVSDWFSGRWQVYNEQTIIDYDPHTGLSTEHRPDRVMTLNEQTLVVDFKFGRPSADHHQQVSRYMSLLQRMGHPHVKGYLCYVYTNKIVAVK